MALDVSGIEEANGTPVTHSLRVLPNPVSARATVGYSLPRSAVVSCAVYDAAGNLVTRLADGTQAAGRHELTWNATGVRPGVYFCKLVASGTTCTARLTKVR
jgi:hypothetical protein